MMVGMSYPVSSSTKLTPEVQQIVSGSREKLVPVIIQTKQGLTKKHQNLVSQQGGKVKRNLNIIKSFSAELPAKAIEALAKQDDVLHISYDGRVEAVLDVATQVIGAPTYWTSSYTGKGVTVAVIDTGIYPHEDLVEPTNRIIAFKDYINGYTQPYDDNGHGTHVAGIIAGNGSKSDGLYQGVAPEANLVGVKVLDDTGTGSKSDVIAGIQWVVDNKDAYQIKVMNLSLGAPATESWKTDPLSLAAQAAWEAGVTVVAAAGNNGPKEGTITTPGINPNIITVGAIDDNGTVDTADDIIASFSSRGPTIDGLEKPDVYAPGVNITSLQADTNYKPKGKKSGSRGKSKAAQANARGKPSKTTSLQPYFTMSGTSMATAVIAGKEALLLD